MKNTRTFTSEDDFEPQPSPHTPTHIYRSFRLPIFGYKVTPLTSSEVIDWISRRVDLGEKSAIANHNLHSLYIMETDGNFQEFYLNHADLILIDGFPVLKLAQVRSSRKLTAHNRIGSLDWVLRLGEIPTLTRIAVVGASRDSNQGAVRALSRHAPSATVRGFHGSGWNASVARAVTDGLIEFRPDIVLVGLGMPLQEHFLNEFWLELPVAIYATVGGAIDQISGKQKAAPRWLGRFGLEWLWRLSSQPSRLAKRYLIEPWILSAIVLRRRLKHDYNNHTL